MGSLGQRRAAEPEQTDVGASTGLELEGGRGRLAGVVGKLKGCGNGRE